MREPQPVEPGYCIHELPLGQCAEAQCRPDRKALQLEYGPGGRPPEPVLVTSTWAARYSGTECGNCGATIQEGQRMGRAAIQTDRDYPYVCGACCGEVTD